MRAIELRPFEPDDIERNTGAVFRRGEFANYFRVVEFDGRERRCRDDTSCASGGSIKAIQNRWLEKRGNVEEHITSANRDDLSDGGDRRQRDFSP